MSSSSSGITQELAGWLLRASRSLRWLPQDVRLFLRYHRPSTVVYCGGSGFGDDLLLTSVLYEMHRRGMRRLAVISRLEDIFRHAPFVNAFIPADWNALRAAKRFGAVCVHPRYHTREEPPDYVVPATTHLITEMCRTAGLKGRVSLRPYFFLTSEERAKGRLHMDQAAIQCTAGSSINFAPLKQWPPERYQQVVDRLRGRFQFVQLGSSGDPPLAGVTDLRGKTTIRESAAVIANSRLMVTYTGFLMHLARAVETPSVIVFGGRERPDQSGYVANENLFTELPCSPCWKLRGCPYDRECLRRVAVDDVVAAVERVVGRGRSTLPIAEENIPEHGEEFKLPWLEPAK